MIKRGQMRCARARIKGVFELVWEPEHEMGRNVLYLQAVKPRPPALRQ